MNIYFFLLFNFLLLITVTASKQKYDSTSQIKNSITFYRFLKVLEPQETKLLIKKNV